ncbi:MAG: hypothetical protein HC786_02685 [Richelia sp. CSU_2_1]|nr:hypothetical protein [Microcoleus sp. SU_5_6]NJL67284.1 hypothetical protein [Microcoleus sp. SM1_3_4]NJR21153.1 hypothetical protein [Richelia sp. CSU_2_1]
MPYNYNLCCLERVANFCGNNSQIARRGNPGHDITINGERFSLKTQAEASVNCK